MKILEAKDKNWSDLCAQVDRDSLGTPYKIVMKRLARKKPIPELELPGRLDMIVDGIFPRKPVTTRTVNNDELEQTGLTEDEVKAAACRSIAPEETRGSLSFHVSQVLTGHGCFGAYLNKYCDLASEACAQCGVTPDSPEHAVFGCDA